MPTLPISSTIPTTIAPDILDVSALGAISKSSNVKNRDATPPTKNTLKVLSILIFLGTFISKKNTKTVIGAIRVPIYGTFISA